MQTQPIISYLIIQVPGEMTNLNVFKNIAIFTTTAHTFTAKLLGIKVKVKLTL
jgi:hypothetical protein